MKIDVSDKLYKVYHDIQLYCVLNELDFDEYITDLLKKSFIIEKYGERPNIASKKTKKTEIVTEGKKTPEIFPQLEDVKVDFSKKQEELKPEVPMTPDDDFIKEITEKLSKTTIIDEYRADVNDGVSESASSNTDEQPKKKLKRKLS